MSISIKLLDSTNTIEKNINIAIAKYINVRLQNSKNTIINSIKNLTPSWIKDQPEIQSLLSSDPTSLVGIFGINRNTSSIVDTIINSISSSLTFEFKKIDNNLNGEFTINIQPSTFQNLLGLSEGYTNYSNGSLHWLEWLLLRGDEIIVANYQYNPSAGAGRSKLGNMITGGSFRVPPQFSGTSDNNFVTRALTGPNQIKKINNIFVQALT
jgi:hypothetical protein